MDFEEMSLLDRVMFEAAEAGDCRISTVQRGHTLYMLEQSEAADRLWVVAFWPEVEQLIIKSIQERCGDDEEDRDGVSWNDIFWNSLERYYIGEFE